MSLKEIFKKFRINSSRKYLEDFAKEAASSIPAGSLVLDAGAGECPYRSFFAHVDYHSTDFCRVERQYAKISYASDLSQLPIADSSYDLVFCSQVLEHIPEPKSVLKEFHRVLKPGGALWLSAPLFFEEHERPYDFFRYTQYGLTHLLESAGFKIIQMEWLEGYYGTLAYQFKVAAKSLPLHPREYGGGFIGWMVIIPILFLKLTLGLSSLLMARLDLRKKFIARGQCKNYTVVAVKKTTSP